MMEQEQVVVKYPQKGKKYIIKVTKQRIHMMAIKLLMYSQLRRFLQIKGTKNIKKARHLLKYTLLL